MADIRPEQRPGADRIYRRWGDLHRANELDKALRQFARQAAIFDSTPSPDELATLKRLLDRAEEAIEHLLESITDLAMDLDDMQTAIDKIKADKDAGRSEWQVFGFADDDDVLERLARIYKLDRHPSQNRLRRDR
jgi:septal ring factor EnvC (AmiA/AmiB activator)